MLKTRCPSCSKLYAVDRKDISGGQDPQFECLQCKTRFIMSLPENFEELDSAEELKSVAIQWQAMPEMVSEPVLRRDLDWLENKPNSDGKILLKGRAWSEEERAFIGESAETVACVKCGFHNFRGTGECIKCGVIFNRIVPEGEHRFRLKPQVIAAWQAAMEDYGNLAVHREFVQTCNVHSCLPFAAYRYQSILEADAGEDVARKMREYVIAMAQAPAIVAQNTGWQPSPTRLRKLMRPLFLVLGFLFAFVHLVTGVPAFRYLGIVSLMAAFAFYLIRLWKSYNIRFDL